MASNWISLVFDTCELGVSSAVSPELLPPNQVAWGLNASVRGGKPGTRPPIALRLALPNGLFQGCEYFGVQGGMLVLSVAGRIYRIRVDGRDFSYEQISLGFVNSGTIRQVWMTQTVETLVIQDGQSNAILYDGSTATRSVYGKVPRGRQMAYGNGRLWVAVNANEAVAGDIRTGSPGSELLFTEATYLQGGGKLFFPSGITGMEFIPVTGQADYGALLLFGRAAANAIRADITTRDDWAKIPGFVTAILRSVGAAGQWCIVSVNQDLYWRDSNGGIRSIRNALADESGPGSAPISREVSRLTDYDSQRQLKYCSAVYFNNRLLMTSSPYLLTDGGVAFKNLISLDFAPLSTMGSKSQAAYNGQWNGLNFLKVVGGDFDGKNRAFALAVDQEGNNQLWEFEQEGRADLFEGCDGTSDGTADGTGDGTADIYHEEYPTTCFIEYPQRDFGQPKRRKRLERCDVWLSEVDGTLELSVYWRPDNSLKWLLWDEAETCAKTTDATVTTPHVWKNLLTQYRPQFKTFTIPDSIIDLVGYDARVGFDFQIRLVWTGKCRIDKVMLHATVLDDPDWADRTGFAEACVEYDVTGNEIAYEIPFGGCAAVAGVDCGGVVAFGTTEGEVIYETYTLRNSGGQILEIGTISTTGDGFSVFSQPAETSLAHNEETTFVIAFTPGVLAAGVHDGFIIIPTSSPDSPCIFTAQATVNTFFFELGLGPFVFPPGAFTDGDGGFYKELNVVGNNAVKAADIPNNPNDRDCSVTLNPTSATGVTFSSWSGLVEFDVGTETYTGELFIAISEEGILPGGGTNRAAGPSQILDGILSLDSAFASLGAAGGLFASENYFQTKAAGEGYFQKWISTDSSNVGYFVSGFMNVIWCPGYSLTALTTGPITVWDLGTAVSETGEAARTQRVDTYDEGTRTYTGNKSRVVISRVIPAGQTYLSGNYTFLVTPTVGTPYRVYLSDEHTVVPGTTEVIELEYPWIVDANVYFESATFSAFPDLSDNFESFTAGDYMSLAGVSTWQTESIFASRPENSDAWDDFENYAVDSVGPLNELLALSTGYAWADAGAFNAVSSEEVIDDLEGYAAGETFVLNQGTGWAGLGMASTTFIYYCDDDLESYAVGSITSLDGGTSYYWAGAGEFA